MKGGDYTMNQAEKAKFLEAFGKRVKEYRLQKELSQEALANMIGYSTDNARSSINKIESGKSDLPASKIYALANALGVPIGKLMGWWDQFDHNLDTVKLQKEVSIIEQIEQSHGKTVSEAFSTFLQLDNEDRKDTQNFMDFKLSKEKYSVQKESPGGKAI